MTLQWLGEGGTAIVWQAQLQDVETQPLAFKVFGRLDRDAVSIKHEQTIYQRLCAEQGQFLPYLMARGVLEPEGQNPRPFLAFTLLSPLQFGAALLASYRDMALDALHGIHSRGVLHGDIKLDNLMVDQDSRRVFSSILKGHV